MNFSQLAGITAANPGQPMNLALVDLGAVTGLSTIEPEVMPAIRPLNPTDLAVEI